MRDVVQVVRDQLGRSRRTALRPRERRAARLARLGSIQEVRAAARAAVPRAVFDFVDGGACDEVTMARNVAAFDALALAQRCLVDVSAVDTSTEVLGRRLPAPVLVAPTGLCGLVHRDGEVALARAAQAAGTVHVLAAMSSYSIEEVRAAAPHARLWFQTYLWRDTGVVDHLVGRAAVAGYEALVVTVDVPRSADRRRDRRHGLTVPPRLTPRSVAGGVRHPRWTRDLLAHPRLTAVNVARRGVDASSVAAYVDGQFDPAAGWADLERLRRRWRGPLVVKGLLHPDDARRAVAVGADAVVVSNHGGRQLDQAPASLHALPAVVDAVGDRAEVLLDSGVRRGSDVLKARALGARACLVGRPAVFGLAAGGEAGVATALRILADEILATMALAGIGRLDDVDAHVLAGGGVLVT